MSLKKYDLAQLIDAVGTGDDLNRMLGIFAESTPKILTSLNDSYINNNLDGVAESAHKLKATIDILKIAELQVVIRKMDRLPTIIENQDDLPQMINATNTIMNQVISEIQTTYLL